MADIVRSIEHDPHGKPRLVLRKKEKPTGTFKLNRQQRDGYPIPLNDAWLFSEEKNKPRFEQKFINGILVTVRLGFDVDMMGAVEEVCKFFDLGEPTTRKMAEIASIIQEGLDDLVSLPPQQKKIVNRGEVKHTVKAMRKGECIGQDVFDHIPINDLVPVGD